MSRETMYLKRRGSTALAYSRWEQHEHIENYENDGMKNLKMLEREKHEHDKKATINIMKHVYKHDKKWRSDQNDENEQHAGKWQ